jgi:malate/lactate dehydrogenase
MKIQISQQLFSKVSEVRKYVLQKHLKTMRIFISQQKVSKSMNFLYDFLQDNLTSELEK